MRKQIIEYTTPLDALIALAKQLTAYELRYQLDSSDFFSQYRQGTTSDEEDLIEWASTYQQYLGLYQELAQRLHPVA